MKVLLELLRIILILAILGGVAWVILDQLYSKNEVVQENRWLGAVGIYALLFVFYRNKLQFSGWYKGKGREKLSKKISLTVIAVSILMIASPILLR
ncbi:hypothetical protein CIL05_09945 [Virgibacillus profundi]|uniref:Uncharacterized protein n=1 Tax=Virgibacillus profundi TaxID=2024555 RepID=A0A2A2IEW5_9BACI|nr:hypothetical protein [Virgibacillus profundi]PAV29685.1 hypothetical protein CIL05_09945 [Virgibacillus profundi]PXY53857.1 hypothetical protein CIT14_10040 [Virgibacillus profundi]